MARAIGGALALGARGSEHVEVDTGVHDVDAVRVGAVELDEVVALVGGVGHEPVGGIDHLLLADYAHGGLGGVTCGEVAVLHLGHRVHRVHERHVPALAGQPAHLPRQPVVRVNEVVPALRARGLGAHDSSGDGTQLSGEILLEQAFKRTGGDVPHEHARGQLDGTAQSRRRGAGEDLDLDPGLGEPS